MEDPSPQHGCKHRNHGMLFRNCVFFFVEPLRYLLSRNCGICCAATGALVFVPQLRNLIRPQGPQLLSHSVLLSLLRFWVPELGICFLSGGPRCLGLAKCDVFLMFAIACFFHLQQQLSSSGEFQFVRQKRNSHLCRSCHRRASHRAHCYRSESK